MNTSIETIGCFNIVLDPFNGITINKTDLPTSRDEFEINLDYLIEDVQHKRNLIWIYIDIKNSDFIPIAIKRGFIFHSCDDDYVLVVKRLMENAIIPTAANHTLGVGAVVINERNQVLVIKERIASSLGYKLPGGHVDNREMISLALQREVKEETGIDVEFESIISLGHFYPHQFHKSNLYVLCKAKALSLDINIQDTKEIEDAKWVDVKEYLNDETVLEYSKAIVKASLNENGLTIGNLDTLNHINRNYELFFSK